MDQLVGAVGSLKSGKPVKTIGSFWSYATTVYGYIYRSMPYERPQSLTAKEVYGVTTYLLHLNNILPETATLDAAALVAVKMPNRDGFTGDPRPTSSTRRV